MPREARISLLGQIHHVMSHSMNEIDLYRDDVDRERFLKKMGEVLKESDCECYGFALMRNHYHFILRPNSVSLSNIMQRVNGSYARTYNIRHGRQGHVFRDRFISLVTQDYWYIREMIRYVHLNPLRANVCSNMEELSRYRWSGHSCVMGYQKLDWMSTDNVLKKFGDEFTEARCMYKDWVASGRGVQENIWDISGLFTPANPEEERLLKDRRVKGSVEFVRSVLEGVKKRKDVLLSNVIIRPNLPDLLRQICRKKQIPPELASKDTRKSDNKVLREEFCREAIYKHGYSLVKTAEFLGIDTSTVLKYLRNVNT